MGRPSDNIEAIRVDCTDSNVEAREALTNSVCQIWSMRVAAV